DCRLPPNSRLQKLVGVVSSRGGTATSTGGFSSTVSAQSLHHEHQGLVPCVSFTISLPHRKQAMMFSFQFRAPNLPIRNFLSRSFPVKDCGLTPEFSGRGEPQQPT